MPPRRFHRAGRVHFRLALAFGLRRLPCNPLDADFKYTIVIRNQPCSKCSGTRTCTQLPHHQHPSGNRGVAAGAAHRWRLPFLVPCATGQGGVSGWWHPLCNAGKEGAASLALIVQRYSSWALRRETHATPPAPLPPYLRYPLDPNERRACSTGDAAALDGHRRGRSHACQDQHRGWNVAWPLFVAFCDLGPSLRIRAQAMAAGTILGAFLLGLGSAIGGPWWVPVPILALATLLSGLLSVYSPVVAQVGVILTILLVSRS